MRRFDVPVARFLRRHRRPVAAVLAALGVLLALASLRPDPPRAAVAVTAASDIRPGEVAVPVALSSAAFAATVGRGDVVDVVYVSNGDDENIARVVARAARVLETPQGAGMFGSSGSAVILLAVAERDALDVVSAASAGAVGVVIRSRRTTPD